MEGQFAFYSQELCQHPKSVQAIFQGFKSSKNHIQISGKKDQQKTKIISKDNTKFQEPKSKEKFLAFVRSFYSNLLIPKIFIYL